MKLVVVLPAFNEEENIAKTIKSIPKKLVGIDKIEILVINDGSTDNTADKAYNSGADRVVTHSANMGVGAAFMTGIRNAISTNADIVVTLDADAQFNSEQIQQLIIPILNKQLDVVIGSRFLKGRPTGIPKIKYFGNKVFTKIVSWSIGQRFTDTQTGFRAYSKDALLNVSVINDFTYTQEVLIDLKFKGIKIGELPVDVTYNDKRKSRVVKSISGYSLRAISIIIKLAFGLFGIFLVILGIIAKIITSTMIFGWGISPGLSTGLIILGIVSFMMGLFANVVFKRQSFAEKDLRHYISQINKNSLE
jgi:glycosyltransferase involved in cell wall biosynthesis